MNTVVLGLAAVIAGVGCSPHRARVRLPDSPSSTSPGSRPPVDAPVCPLGTEPWITERHSYCSLPDGRRHGPYASFRSSGQLRSRGTYSVGARVGVWVLYHENGRVAADGTFVDGHKHGRWRAWFDDGTRSIDAEFERGHRVGAWSWYDQAGLFKQGEYVAGARTGLWTLWHENGKKAEECVFTNGQQAGARLSWYANGVLASLTLPQREATCWDETGVRMAAPCVALLHCTAETADDFWISW